MPGPLPKYAINLTAEQTMCLQQLSACYTAPFAAVQRARILLLAHQRPTWRNADIARQVGCAVNTVKLSGASVVPQFQVIPAKVGILTS